MTSQESITLDSAGAHAEAPAEKAVDKTRVLSHLQRQLAELAEQAEEEGADDGNA